MMIRFAMGAALLLASVADASTIAPPTKMTCPVGGRAFTHIGYGSYSSWGALPDGQPVGSAPFPIGMPECPDNGLVLYERFDPATVRRLGPLVAGAEYQGLRGGDTQRYRAQWLQTRLGVVESETVWTLLEATWEAKNTGNAAMVTRYNEEFIRRARAIPGDPTSPASLALRARIVNALRELGRFGEAEVLRASFAAEPMPSAAGPEADVNRRGWLGYLAGLAPVIARRDPSRAPIDLIGEREARFRCLAPERRDFTGQPLTSFEREYCDQAELQEGMGELRRAWGVNPVATPNS